LRLFIALYPADDAVADLQRFVSSLALGRPAEPGRSLRLTRPDTWHVTLAFIGAVPDGRAAAAATALGAAVEAWREAPEVADGASDERLRIAGAGRFGRGRFTTVWAGLSGDVAGLERLAERVRRELKRARVPFDRKAFQPHVTLARPADRLPAEVLAADLAALDRYQGPQWTIEDVRLTRSHLGPDPQYETVAAFPSRPAR
jgi:2'-5' RNA ligase